MDATRKVFRIFGIAIMAFAVVGIVASVALMITKHEYVIGILNIAFMGVLGIYTGFQAYDKEIVRTINLTLPADSTGYLRPMANGDIQFSTEKKPVEESNDTPAGDRPAVDNSLDINVKEAVTE
jgi:hypothetical protein